MCDDAGSGLCLSAGMNMSPVARLRKTWSKVNTDKFEILEVRKPAYLYHDDGIMSFYSLATILQYRVPQYCITAVVPGTDAC